MALPISGSSTNAPVIDSPQVGVTWLAGLSAAVTALIAAGLSVAQAFEVLNVTDPVKIGLIGLVGAGLLSWAIAAAGDALARAYASAHVTRTKPGEENQPALQVAASKFAEVYAAANPAVDAKKTAEAAQVRLCPFPTPLAIRAQGKDAHALAVLISGEAGKEEQRYLVGRAGSKLTWVNGDEIYMP
jgi:hypothetical protein